MSAPRLLSERWALAQKRLNPNPSCDACGSGFMADGRQVLCPACRRRPRGCYVQPLLAAQTVSCVAGAPVECTAPESIAPATWLSSHGVQRSRGAR